MHFVCKKMELEHVKRKLEKPVVKLCYIRIIQLNRDTAFLDNEIIWSSGLKGKLSDINLCKHGWMSVDGYTHSLQANCRTILVKLDLSELSNLLKLIISPQKIPLRKYINAKFCKSFHSIQIHKYKLEQNFCTKLFGNFCCSIMQIFYGRLNNSTLDLKCESKISNISIPIITLSHYLYSCQTPVNWKDKMLTSFDPCQSFTKRAKANEWLLRYSIILFESP